MSAPSIPAFSPTPSDIDFVTLAQVKTWIEGMKPAVASVDDDVLQFIITSTSQDMLNEMSREAILKQDYQEWYDGTGSETLPIDNWPVQSINVLKINGVVINPSLDHQQNGYIISRDKRFIQLIGGGGGFVPGFGVSVGISSAYGRRCRNVFTQGIGNVYIDYYGGYPVLPTDLGEACLMIIDQDYKRRGWVDRAQIAIPQGGGTTTYRSWPIPTRALQIMQNYTRAYHP